jgi:hypothetical protein
MAHLVTGYAGQAHIKSADEGAFNASFFGDGQYITELGNQFEGSIINNNTVRISDGDGLMYGRHFRIEPNTYEDLTITTGTAGKNRIDLICMTYEKNPDDETERCYLQVIKGTEADGTPSVPEYTNGNIIEGASFNQMPLYKVIIEGVVLSRIERLFATIPPYEMIATSFSNTNLLVNGAFQVWQRGESFTGTSDKVIYSADRWTSQLDCNVTRNYGHGIRHKITKECYGAFSQLLEVSNEMYNFFVNKRLTLSVHMKTNRVMTLKMGLKNHPDNIVTKENEWGTYTVPITPINDDFVSKDGRYSLEVCAFLGNFEINDVIDLSLVKLEFGECATSYVVPLYNDELIRCGSPDNSSNFGYKSGFLSKSDVVDNLESDRADLPLSARMGSELNKKINDYYKLSVTTPSNDTITKVADYPNGYTYDNTFVESAYVVYDGQKRFINESGAGVCLVLKTDAIYLYASGTSYRGKQYCAILKKY